MNDCNHLNSVFKDTDDISYRLQWQASEESSSSQSTPRDNANEERTTSSKDEGPTRVDEIGRAAYDDDEVQPDEYTSLLPRGNDNQLCWFTPGFRIGLTVNLDPNPRKNRNQSRPLNSPTEIHF